MGDRPAFSLGHIVYLKLREEKILGMVTGYLVRPSSIAYLVCWANTGDEKEHFEMELTSEYNPFGMTDG